MKISKSSWHYKLFNFLYDYSILRTDGDLKYPKTLCGYFWLLFLFAPFIFLMTWFFLLPGTLLIALITAPIWLPIVGWMFFRDKSETFRNKTQFMVKSAKSFKSKFCPFIEWKD